MTTTSVTIEGNMYMVYSHQINCNVLSAAGILLPLPATDTDASTCKCCMAGIVYICMHGAGLCERDARAARREIIHIRISACMH